MNAPTETDEMNAPTETEADQELTAEDDLDMPQGADPDPAGVVTASVPESPDPAAPEYEGAANADDAWAEPDVADESDADESDADVSEPELTLASPVAEDGTSADERWHEILTMFVDDPRSSVELAAGLVDDSAEALVVFVQERQRALLSTWQGDDAGTEQMRVALQGYRTFWNRIEDLSHEA
jgi:hypothetical protein